MKAVRRQGKDSRRDRGARHGASRGADHRPRPVFRGGPGRLAVERSQKKLVACGHSGCAPDQCLVPSGGVGEWYWMRSPDQERRVVMALYNRYCIRCHGIDGRGVWDIPDVPDFTDPQAGRRSRGPTRRSSTSSSKAGAPSHARVPRNAHYLRGSLGHVARYLRTFVPGTEVARAPRCRPRAAAPPPPHREPRL